MLLGLTPPYNYPSYCYRVQLVCSQELTLAVLVHGILTLRCIASPDGGLISEGGFIHLVDQLSTLVVIVLFLFCSL